MGVFFMAFLLWLLRKGDQSMPEASQMGHVNQDYPR